MATWPVALKAAAPGRLSAVLALAEALAEGRDAAAEDELLRPFGEIGPADWSIDAARASMARRR